MEDDPGGDSLQRRALGALRERAGVLGPALRAMLWTIAAGMLFAALNAAMRAMAQQLDPHQTQCLRYLFGMLVMLPLVLRSGLAAYWPNDLRGQLLRGLVHTAGMALWYTALPKIPLADTTAIGFTTPIFMMIGAALALGERMYRARWVAAAIGFAGVLIVVSPKLSGQGGYYNLVMLAAAPVSASSFLIAKVLTRRDAPEVIVLWQGLTVALFTLPLALAGWVRPSAAQWSVFVLAGVLGSLGHYCLNRGFRAADISATQPVRFLEVIWASALGYLVFADVPTQTTMIGAAVISLATAWIARHEARRPAALRTVRGEHEAARAERT